MYHSCKIADLTVLCGSLQTVISDMLFASFPPFFCFKMLFKVISNNINRYSDINHELPWML